MIRYACYKRPDGVDGEDGLRNAAEYPHTLAAGTACCAAPENKGCGLHIPGKAVQNAARGRRLEEAHWRPEDSEGHPLVQLT